MRFSAPMAVSLGSKQGSIAAVAVRFSFVLKHSQHLKTNFSYDCYQMHTELPPHEIFRNSFSFTLSHNHLQLFVLSQSLTSE